MSTPPRRRVGSLVGSGVVTNASSTAGTLTFGWDEQQHGAGDAWSGTFARYSDGMPEQPERDQSRHRPFVMSGTMTSRALHRSTRAACSVNE